MTTPPTASPRPTPETAPGSQTFSHVACPFCGIACDDLEVARSGTAITVRANGCAKAKAGFERVLPAATATVRGAPVTMIEAIAEAARLIRASRLPLYGGLATDVEGVRAILSLADRTGGVIDHALSEGQYRNFKVLQSTGWVMTTLTEARNRADLFIIVGTDVHTLHPRFFERTVCNAESMFDAPAKKRTIVFIGTGLDQSGAIGPRIGDVVTLGCPNERVGEVILALKARLKGVAIQGATVAGVPIAAIDDLASRCHSAAYGVMVWAPLVFDFPNADLTVQAIADTVRELNVTQRFAGLSLGGSEGSVTAAAVTSWQSGFPLRVSFASGKPSYDANRYAIARMLAAGEGDLLVWTASYTPGIAVPQTSLPAIVLGTPGLALATPPAVYIPVGTPGIDHAGRIVRCDSVVTLPLRNLSRSALPSVAEVASAIETAIQV
jgi:formylmethanofuran dehydrogenase subunit B